MSQHFSLRAGDNIGTEAGKVGSSDTHTPFHLLLSTAFCNGSFDAPNTFFQCLIFWISVNAFLCPEISLDHLQDCLRCYTASS